MVRHRLVKEIVQAYDKFDVAEQRRDAERQLRRREGNDQQQRPFGRDDHRPSNGYRDRVHPDDRAYELPESELPVNHEQGL